MWLELSSVASATLLTSSCHSQVAMRGSIIRNGWPQKSRKGFLRFDVNCARAYRRLESWSAPMLYCDFLWQFLCLGGVRRGPVDDTHLSCAIGRVGHQFRG